MKYKSEIDFEQEEMVEMVGFCLTRDITTHEKFMFIINAVNKYKRFLNDLEELEGRGEDDEEE